RGGAADVVAASPEARSDPFLVLGIETSCDETAAAVVANGAAILSSVVSSQVDLHARFGGVVPEIASRAHVELLTPVTAEALVESGVTEGVDAVAATIGPGLAGALLIGVSAAIPFPRAMIDDGYDFSFSGLKTAVINYVRKHPDVSTPDVAASFQAAVVDVLVTKAVRAAAETGVESLCLGGGVAANSLLRERTAEACAKRGLRAVLPSRAMCTDNAAMVAAAGWWRLQSDGPTPLDAGISPNLQLPV